VSTCARTRMPVVPWKSGASAPRKLRQSARALAPKGTSRRRRPPLAISVHHFQPLVPHPRVLCKSLRVPRPCLCVLRRDRAGTLISKSARWEDTTNGIIPPPVAHNIQAAACRPATFLSRVFQETYTTGGFCAQGTSGGSGAIAYSMAWYGWGSSSTQPLDKVELNVGRHRRLIRSSGFPFQQLSQNLLNRKKFP
jgi:hypothetical protein